MSKSEKNVVIETALILAGPLLIVDTWMKYLKHLSISNILQSIEHTFYNIYEILHKLKEREEE